MDFLYSKILKQLRWNNPVHTQWTNGAAEGDNACGWICLCHYGLVHWRCKKRDGVLYCKNTVKEYILVVACDWAFNCVHDFFISVSPAYPGHVIDLGILSIYLSCSITTGKAVKDIVLGYIVSCGVGFQLHAAGYLMTIVYRFTLIRTCNRY